MGRNQLIIFVKAPRIGHVKTRLAQGIGPEAACSAYRCMAEIVLQNVSSLEHVQLRFTPDDAYLEVQPWMRPGWSLAKQGPGDLGERLGRAVASAFAAGAERLVIIGGDCPDVQASDIETAWAELATHDVVLGPAEDGGYYLIGLRRAELELFKNIAWSTDSVLQSTVQGAKALSLKVQLLRTLHDIDTVEDLRRWQSRCAHR